MKIVRNLIPLGLILLLALAPATALGQNTYKYLSEGPTAWAYPPGTVNINGVDYRVQLVLTGNPSTNTTQLTLRLITGPGPNRTMRFVVGVIPNTDWVMASDLSTATLNTVINTTPNNFDNPDVGPIFGLAINLTWSADLLGRLNDNWNFWLRDEGKPPYLYHETWHANNPHAESTVTGNIGAIVYPGFYGYIDQYGMRAIVREITH